MIRLLLSTALLLAGSAALAQGSEIYASSLPAGDRLHAEALQPFFREVQRLTRGSVTFDLAAGGVVAGAASLPGALREGAADAAILSPRSMVGSLSFATAISDLAHGSSDPRVATAALNETILRGCPACVAAFAERGIVVLGLAVSDPPLLHCRMETAGLPELRGRHVAAVSGLHPVLKALGALPEEQPQQAILDRLIDGRLDCAAAPVSEAADRLWSAAKHVTGLPLGGAPGWLLVTMAKRSWDGLVDRQRAAIVAAAPIALRGAVQSAMTEAATFAALAGARGVVWHQPSAELREKVDAFWKAEPMPPTEKQRRPLPGDLTQRFRQSAAKWTQIVGNDFDQYEAALRREIYATLTP